MDNQQQKNKKNNNKEKTVKKQNDKKKVQQTQANGVKHVPKPAPAQKQKKKNNKKLATKGKSDSFMQHLIRLILFQVGILWFLYIVDYQKFSQIRSGAASVFNSTLQVMPPEVVAKGRETFEYVRVPAELAMNHVAKVVNDTSTFLNTNPLVKDHWAIIRDISLIFSARATDFMRTVYVRVTGYAVDFKNKFIQ